MSGKTSASQACFSKAFAHYNVFPGCYYHDSTTMPAFHPWLAAIVVSSIVQGLDHLSMIDSITRTVRDNRYLSRMIGVLFSFGHGLVVMIISVIVGSGIMQSKPPAWLDDFGNGISIFFLFTFGILTLWNVFQKQKQFVSTSLKVLLLRKIINQRCNPLLIMFIGALFAFSFDTFSQVALFSISASLFSGWLFSAVLGVLFMLGMMVSDGVNGLFVSRLIQRADKTSLFISRVLGVAISGFSLTVGTLNLIQFISSTWYEPTWTTQGEELRLSSLGKPHCFVPRQAAGNKFKLA